MDFEVAREGASRGAVGSVSIHFRAFQELSGCVFGGFHGDLGALQEHRGGLGGFCEAFSEESVDFQ